MLEAERKQELDPKKFTGKLRGWFDSSKCEHRFSDLVTYSV